MLIRRIRSLFWASIDKAFHLDFWPSFLGGSVLIAFLLTLLQLFKFSDDFIKFGVNSEVFFPVFSQYMIIFSPMILMIGYTTGVVSAYSRMSNDSEITAWKASGSGIGRILRPSLILAVLLTAANGFLAIDIVPKHERKLYRMIQQMGKAEVVGAIRGGVFRTNFFGLTLYADESDKDTGHMKKVFLYDQRNPDEPQIISAAEGDFISLENSSNFSTSLLLRLRNGAILTQTANSPDSGRLRFQYYELLIETKEAVIGGSSKTRLISGRDLPELIQNEQDDSRKRTLINEAMKRIVFSVSYIPFAFFGAGLSITRPRKRRLAPAGIILSAIVLFWVLYLLASNLGVNGTLSPWIAPLAPVAFTSIVGLLAYRRASW